MKAASLTLVRFGIPILSAVTFLAAGCDTRKLPLSQLATTEQTYALTASWPTFAQGLDVGANAKVDLLFMIDNSSSMTALQLKLTASFSEFMTAIENLPGGVPDLHIGVVSSDMGAGLSMDATGCSAVGDGARLHADPRVPGCTAPSAGFLALSRDPATGVVVTNYGTQSLSSAFSCVATLGEGGCGLEHQFSAVRHALDPALAPRENAGFLRDDAYLAVVMLTNEDDCSAPLDTQLFDGSSQYISDPLGPLISFRCNYLGHICNDGHKNGPPSLTKGGVLTDCHSAEDGRLDRVADFVSFLKGLKGDPARVFFGAVTGPATPYEVTIDSPPTNNDPAGVWPQVQHSCMAADHSYADPAVRISEAVTAFGTHGMLASICGDSMAPALHALSTTLVQPMQPSCVDVDSAGPGCTVVDRWVDGSGVRQAARLVSCAENPSAVPCWHLDDDATCGAPQKHLVVDRGAMIPDHLFTAVDCTTAHP